MSRKSLSRLLALAAAAPLTLAVAATAVAVALVPGAAAAWQYDRALIATGQPWRLLTGHLTHWSANHAFWDVLMLLMLGILLEPRGRGRLLLLLLGSAAAISLSLWTLQPDLATYRGLSGLDTALFAFLAVRLLADTRRRGNARRALLPAMLLAGFAAKLACESATGAALFADARAAGFTVVPLAHLVGAAAGAALALADGTLRRRPRNPPQTGAKVAHS